MSRPTTSLCAAAALAALLLAGCGGGDEGGDTPASIAPQDASLYVQATIRPEGDQKDAVNELITKVSGESDPGAEVERLIDEGFSSEGEDRTYAKDVEPWLGDAAAVFVVGFETDPPAVVAVSSDDPEAGLELLRSESTDLTDAEHEGSSYQLDEDGQAFGEIDGYVVFGDEVAYKAAIDASKGDSLAESDDFSSSEESVPDEAIASAYLNMDELGRAVSREEGTPPDVTNSFFDTAVGDGPLVGWLTPNSDSLEMEVSGGTSALTGTGGQDVLGSVPADAWLAIDMGDLGQVADNVLDQTDEITGLSRQTVLSQLRSRSGIDLDRDVLSWLGDAALFVSGTTQADIGGALVIESTDPAASARGLKTLAAVAARSSGSQVTPLGGGGRTGFQISDPGTPQPLQVFQQDDKVVVAYGQQAAAEAAAPSRTLGETSSLQAATAGLGDAQPTFFLDFPTVLALAEKMGSAGDPGYLQAKPYLRALSYVVAAAGSEDDRSLFRLLVGVR